MSQQARKKLGLALAGGGFRATLFHLGVLYRLAQLDLLRRVEVLSTVSGGSITGAVYALLLKECLEENPNPDRDAYVELVKRLDCILTRGIRKNPRWLLFLNPFGTLRVLLTEHSLARRMARLYERYFFATVVKQLKHRTPPSRWQRLWRRGRILLKDIRPRPGGEELDRGGLETYNVREEEKTEHDREPGAVVTNLVVNATTLNSGGRFWFSAREIGDWYLGHIRFNEVPEVRARKWLMQELDDKELEEHLSPEAVEWPPSAPSRSKRGSSNPQVVRLPQKTVALARWLRALGGWRNQSELRSITTPNGWDAIFDCGAASDACGYDDYFRRSVFRSGAGTLVKALLEAEPGLLRQAKIPAWYIRRGVPQGIDGHRTPEEHWQRFREAVWKCDRRLAREDFPPLVTGAVSEALLDFTLEVYWMRTAECVSPRIQRDLDNLTLSDAVGASACFPPVFPPFTMLGIYDDARVSRLGLTDGGVFDNAGITALLDKGCNYIIASDTGGMFVEQSRVSVGRVGLAARVATVLGTAMARNQRWEIQERRELCQRYRLLQSGIDAEIDRRVAERLRSLMPHPAGAAVPDTLAAVGALAGTKASPTAQPPGGVAGPAAAILADPLGDFLALRELRGLAHFHIASPEVVPDGARRSGLAPHREAIAELRTDLDGFGDLEIAALVNHGYYMADGYVRTELRDYANRYWNEGLRPPEEWPLTIDDRLARAIRAGRSRAFKALRLRNPFSWGVVLLAAAWLLGATQDVRFSAGQAIQTTAAGLTSWIDGGFWPWPGPGWTARPLPWVWLGIVAGLVFLLSKTVFQKTPVDVSGTRSVKWARRLASTWKWIRSYSGNGLWLFGSVPVAIALLGTAAAIVNYAVFYFPFLWATRQRGRPAVQAGRS